MPQLALVVAGRDPARSAQACSEQDLTTTVVDEPLPRLSTASPAPNNSTYLPRRVDAERLEGPLEDLQRQQHTAETQAQLPTVVTDPDKVVQQVLLVDRIQLLRAESAKIREKIRETEEKSRSIDMLRQRSEQPPQEVERGAEELKAALAVKARLAEAKSTLASLNSALKKEAAQLDDSLQALQRRRDELLNRGAAHCSAIGAVSG